jgi:hypothetical protein
LLTPISLVAGGDDTTRPGRQGLFPLKKKLQKLTMEINLPKENGENCRVYRYKNLILIKFDCKSS